MFIFYAGLFVVTPLLMYHKTSELFELNKMLFIYFVAACVLFVWIVEMITYKKIILKKTVLDIPILLFVLSQIISAIFSIDRHTSVFGYYGRFNGGLLSLLAYLILYYAFVSHFVRDGFKRLSLMLAISLAASTAVVLIGLPGRWNRDLLCWVFTGVMNNSCWTQQFAPAIRMFSTLGQPNWLGAYLAIHFFIGLYFLARSRKEKNFSTIVYTCYLLLNFTGILFTRSRSTLLALAVGMAFFLVWAFICKYSWHKKMLFVLLLLIIPLLIFKTNIPAIDRFIPVAARPSLPLSNKALKISDSADIRKIVWEGAWQLAIRYPLFGTGIETFAYAYYFTRPLPHNMTSEWDFVYNKAHNEYLNYAAATGFIGLGTYLVFIMLVLWYAIQKFKVQMSTPLDLTLLCAWITILITNFFGFSTTTVNLFFFLIPAFMMVSQQHHPKEKPIKIQKIVRWQKFGFGASALLFLMAVLFLIGFFIADISYSRATQYSRADQYDAAATSLKFALSIHYEPVYEDKLSSYLATAAYLSSYQKDPAATQALIEEADRYSVRALAASPKNVLYTRTRAKNYFLFYQITSRQRYFDESLISFDRAIGLAPTDPKTWYMKALVYSFAYDEEKDKEKQAEYRNASLATLDRALKLKNDYPDAMTLKEQLFKKYGKQ